MVNKQAHVNPDSLLSLAAAVNVSYYNTVWHDHVTRSVTHIHVRMSTPVRQRRLMAITDQWPSVCPPTLLVYTVVWENFAIKINISGVTPWKLNTQFFNWINREGVLFLDTDDADVCCAMDDIVVV